MPRAKTPTLYVMTAALILSACGSQQLATVESLAPSQTTPAPEAISDVPGVASPSSGEEMATPPNPGITDPTPPPPPSVLKPADSDSPAAGICGTSQDDPVAIVLGLGSDGLPLGGRCIQITPAQRIKLVNQSNAPLNFLFGEYQIDIPAGGEMVLDKPTGEFLALGVHFLPMGPELWVREAVADSTSLSPAAYSNLGTGDVISLVVDWQIHWAV